MPNQQNESRVRIEIGSGEKPQRPSYLHLDARAIPGVEIVTDASHLPIVSDIVDEVYAAHMIEHLSYADGRKFIAEVNRTLKENGRFELSCPDLERATAIYEKVADLTHKVARVDAVRSIFYGAQSHTFDFHLAGYDFKLLSQELGEAGFGRIRRLEPGSGIPRTQSPFVRSLYELHVEAFKGVFESSNEQTTQKGIRNESEADNYLLKELALRDAEINRLEGLVEQISESHARINAMSRELDLIKYSFGYKFMKFYAGIINALSPEGTTRGKLRKIAVASLHVLTEQGVASLVRRIFYKIKHREFTIIDPAEKRPTKATQSPSIPSTRDVNDDALQREF